MEWIEERVSLPSETLSTVWSSASGCLFTSNATSASTLLSAIAGAVMVVLSLVFHGTGISQFTPRALRCFLADHMTQSIAGSFSPSAPRSCVPRI